MLHTFVPPVLSRSGDADPAWLAERLSLARPGPDPFVIRPSEFPDMASLARYVDDVAAMRLLPVKDQATYDAYHRLDRAAWTEAMRRELFHCGGAALCPNMFEYWLPRDANQYILWSDGSRPWAECLRIAASAVAGAGLDPLQVVAFERPEDADGTLVRGTLPGLRHAHIWTPKKLCSTHTL